MIKNETIEKEYLAIVTGILEKKTGTIDKPIARKSGSIIEREINEEGQRAITHYEAIKEDKENNLSLLCLKLETR